MLTLYPDGRLTRFAKATKTPGAAKVYWRRLNSCIGVDFCKEYFFADIYRPRAITLPLAAHAWRGVNNCVTSLVHANFEVYVTM